jgi:hypothetical protein
MELVMKNALSPQIHLAVQSAFRSGAFRSARQPSKRDARFTTKCHARKVPLDKPAFVVDVSTQAHGRRSKQFVSIATALVAAGHNRRSLELSGNASENTFQDNVQLRMLFIVRRRHEFNAAVGYQPMDLIEITLFPLFIVLCSEFIDSSEPCPMSEAGKQPGAFPMVSQRLFRNYFSHFFSLFEHEMHIDQDFVRIFLLGAPFDFFPELLAR